MALQPLAETAVAVEQFVLRHDPDRPEDRVQQRRGVPLGEDQVVVDRLTRRVRPIVGAGSVVVIRWLPVLWRSSSVVSFRRQHACGGRFGFGQAAVLSQPEEQGEGGDDQHGDQADHNQFGCFGAGGCGCLPDGQAGR
jgi:hypothetical protein